jgi:ribosomal-protein-alanine N-acetyltransferase
MRCDPCAVPAALAAVHAECFPADPWAEGALAALLSGPGVQAWIGMDGDEPVGLILTRLVLDEAEVLTIGVRPGARRAGHGAALLATAMAALEAQGCSRLFLEVAAGNAAAQVLYARAGFTSAGRRTCYYPDGSDALLLIRTLAGPDKGLSTGT